VPANHDPNPIRSMGIIKDGKSDGVLYRIAIEIEEEEVELIEVEACETGFRTARVSQTFQSYTLPGLLC
jgi:cation transport regulator ChaC